MKVIAVDINDDKLNLAKEVGADYIINSLHEDPAKKILEITNGGAHGVVVSAVAKIAFDQAVYSVRAGGRVVAVGLPSEMMDIPIIKTVIDGIEVYHSSFTNEQSEKLVKYCTDNNILMSGGSDCHGDKYIDRQLGIGKGNMKIEDKILKGWKI